MASNKEIASLVIKFLNDSLSKGDVPSDNKDSLEFAIESIADAFGVEKDNVESVLGSKFGGKGLAELVKVQPTAETKTVPGAAPATSDGPGSSATKSKNIPTPDSSVEQKANELKLEGNKAMARRDFEEAIEKYSEAIKLVPTNAVYLSNRAAAYSSIRKHDLAVKDAEKATEVDPSYAKAWSRMGLAKYALGDAKGAMDAYSQGLKAEGTVHSPAMQKGYDTSKNRVAEQMASGLDDNLEGDVDRSTTSNNSGSAGSNPLGGLGDLGGLSGLLNNPQVMQAAQQMMQNPDALRNLMNNPQLRQMAQSMGLGGGAGSGAGAGAGAGAEGGNASGSGSTPSMEELLNNPMLRNMANQFMGGQNNNAGNNEH
ncbi:DEKNAAC103276 [Brettanomyces naardenensis]|uniref:DEKNAAC103276 n=1 Tax=Brettanomyces naardenensis TaxID=13370 RepID=A0A448YN39_BRENA|nr:DEKNAAC103276 [Brettanomyces naardenensis]